MTVKQRDFLVFRDFDGCGVFQGWVWLTTVVPSILRVQWVYIRALSGDIDASGSFLGSLKGLEIAISLCDSAKHVIFLFFTMLTMLWCFPWLGMADKSCSEHITGTLGAH